LSYYLTFLLVASLLYARDKPEATTNVPHSAPSGSQGSANGAAASSANRKCEKEEIYRVGHGVSVPQVVYSHPPEYTDSARRAKKKGSVVLSFVVASDGRTCNIKIDKHLDPDLDGQAVEAVSSWRFQPAMRDGKPVAVYLGASVDFKLY